MKGVFAVIVLLHHLYQSSGVIENRYIGALFQASGYWAVSMFFFLSGYGLQTSYARKKDAYISGFPRKKLLPFYCVMAVLVLIYAPISILIGESVPLIDILRSFLFGKTVISKGWYLQVQLFLYILFYLIWRFVKNDRAKQAVLFAAILIHTILCVAFGVTLTRYITLFCFNLGILFSYKSVFISENWQKTKIYVFSVVSVFILIGVTFGLWHFTEGAVSTVSLAACQLLFVIFVVLAVWKVPIVNPVTAYLGKYSLEIYVTQGLFLHFYHSKLIFVSNDGLYILLVIVSTYLASLTFHPLIRRIYALICGK